jgi:UDP-N-acetylglucosamine 4,6-dehydratase
MQLEGSIFVTGGAGFLARGLYARARRDGWPCRFTAFSRDAHKHVALRRDFPEVHTMAGDVAGSLDTLVLALAGHEIVIHAAAYKYVDLAETNVWECVRTNVLGSLLVAQAAALAGVGRVVGISTDKACHAVNVYGGTKYQMEKLFQEADTWETDTRFHLTRYGNVLASTGSIVTDWRRKLKEQGYINATDPDMTRFWLSLDQAVDLILLALKELHGTIVIPKLPALSMKRMEEYILPAGTRVTYDGMRPGEKRHETLLTLEESRFAYDNGDYFRLHPVWITPRNEHDWQFYSSDLAREMSRDELLGIVGEH